MKAIETTAYFDNAGLLKIDDLPLIKNQHVKLLFLIEDQTDWYKFSGEGLSAAYGENEPDYTLDLITEPNPGYQLPINHD